MKVSQSLGGHSHLPDGQIASYTIWVPAFAGMSGKR